MEWIEIVAVDQLESLRKESFEKPQIIFKHSTRCSISVMAKNRLERSEIPQDIDFHYLDLLQYRPISDLVAEVYHVHHQSPQVLLIVDGECIYEDSHNAISMESLLEQIPA